MRLIYEIDAPAHWASYLVNGDDSSMGEGELQECAAWLENQPFSLSECTDAEGECMGYFNFAEQGNLQCMLATYIFITDGVIK